MLDRFDPLTDLDQIRSRYDVLRILRHDDVDNTDSSGNFDSGAVYAVRARGAERHYLVNLRPAGRAGGSHAGALQSWQAHTIRPLEHPKLMTIHAVHHLQGGGLAVAIDRRRGRTLAARIESGGPVPADEAERHIRDLAEALFFLHERGVVHRGVHPEAVFLDQDAEVTRLAPFAVEPRERGGVKTGKQLAPESLGGEYHDRAASPRSDLHALGVLGYRMLCGPVGEAAEEDAGSLARPWRARPLSEIRPDVSPALCAALEGCLARRPRNRWRDAGELLACLESEAPRPPATRRWARIPDLGRHVRHLAGMLPLRSASNGAANRHMLGIALATGAAAIALATILGIQSRPAATALQAERRPVEVRMEHTENALLESPDPVRAARATTPRAGDAANLGPTDVLQVEHDSFGGAASMSPSVSPTPARSGFPRERAATAPAPTRVVLLGEPIEP